jgi:hypothetical protein
MTISAKLTDAILECIDGPYVLENGSQIQGVGISTLSQILREKGWKNVSHLNNLISTAEDLGFKVVRAQFIKGSGKLAPFAQVITL